MLKRETTQKRMLARWAGGIVPMLELSQLQKRLGKHSRNLLLIASDSVEVNPQSFIVPAVDEQTADELGMCGSQIPRTA